MEITKVVKPFIRRGANTFGNIVYLSQAAKNMELLFQKSWDESKKTIRN